MSKDSNEFVWTDELVKEFTATNWMLHNHKLLVAIEEFKASKQPVSLDWEIWELKSNVGNANMNSWNMGKACAFSIVSIDFKIWHIHQVKRLRDGEVFTVGDNIISIYYGYNPKARTIKSFIIHGTDIQIRQEYGISYLKDVSPAPLKESKPLFDEKKINQRIEQIKELEEAFKAGKLFVDFKSYCEWKQEINLKDSNKLTK